LQAIQEPSPLSSSCRHAALASLARLGHSAANVADFAEPQGPRGAADGGADTVEGGQGVPWRIIAEV